MLTSSSGCGVPGSPESLLSMCSGGTSIDIEASGVLLAGGLKDRPLLKMFGSEYAGMSLPG